MWLTEGNPKKIRAELSRRGSRVSIAFVSWRGSTVWLLIGSATVLGSACGGSVQDDRGGDAPASGAAGMVGTGGGPLRDAEPQRGAGAAAGAQGSTGGLGRGGIDGSAGILGRAGSGGVPAGGAAGSAQGGTGGVPYCCEDRTECPPGYDCINTRCLSTMLDGCWRSTDCRDGERCEGASICACTDGCAGERLGRCVSIVPECCLTDEDCGDVVYVPCVANVCKFPVDGKCWTDAECRNGFKCQGAHVYPCGMRGTREDTLGTCVAPPDAGASD